MDLEKLILRCAHCELLVPHIVLDKQQGVRLAQWIVKCENCGQENDYNPDTKEE